MAKTNIGTAYVQILPTTEGIQSKIREALRAPMKEVGEKSGHVLGNALGKGLKASAKIAIAGISVASTALTVLTKQSVAQYAEFEQLSGGVAKLFGENSDAVMESAARAYKTAGLDANQYMETVTSFSASLISGLSGDTAEAARVADIAIQDMADNANTFGTDMASVQAAYQGFAKGNYTMLDNLKLGYGGTASEMARLVNESGVLDGAFEATAENVKDIPFDILIQAIHATQDEMGITGTTANEAMGTISGSIGAAKAAWSNLITGIADENANLDELIDNFLETIIGVNGEGGVINNIVPVVERVLGGISTLVSTVVPKLIPLAVNLIRSNLPGLARAGGELFAALLAGIAGALPDLIRAVPNIVRTFIGALKNAWPEIKAAGSDLLNVIGDGIASMWERVKEWGADLVRNFAAGIKEHLSEAWDAIKSMFEVRVNANYAGYQHTFDGVDWTGMNFAKAYDTPYLFSRPTIAGGVQFGDGPGAEMVYGRNSLMRDIREATADSGTTINFSPTIHIDGDIQDPRAKAQELMYEMKLILDREAAAYA